MKTGPWSDEEVEILRRAMHLRVRGYIKTVARELDRPFTCVASKTHTIRIADERAKARARFEASVRVGA
jgi:hypothetical protein